MEGREHRDTGTFEGKMAETQGSTTVSTKLERIAKLAREMPQAALTTLAHHIDIDWLHEAYRRTRKSGATGVDRQTAEEYAGNLEANLRSLLERAKSGSYVAPPVRRVHVPKGDGSQTRPIGIPTFEDKVLQRAVAMVLEAVYEQSFLDCSYGFRSGRSAHQALRLVQNQTVKMAGKWVLEVDIRKFFDTLEHSQLREIVRKRVRDGVLLRLIGKWLNAGVMEDGAIQYPEAGTPQGGVITPRTQKRTSSLSGWWRTGGIPRSLIYVSKGNILMSYVPVHKDGQSTTAERSSWAARAQHRVARGSEASVARVRYVTAPSLSISGASRQTRPSSAGRGSLSSNHLEAPTAHRAYVALLCCQQRPDARGDRHTCAEGVSQRCSKAWLSDVQDVSAFKSISTIRLIAYAGRNSRRCMSFWCPRSSAWSAHV